MSCQLAVVLQLKLRLELVHHRLANTECLMAGSIVEMLFSGDQIFWNLLERLRNLFPCGFLVFGSSGILAMWGAVGRVRGISAGGFVQPHAACTSSLLLLSSASHLFTRVTVRHIVYSSFTTFLTWTFQNSLLRVLYKKSQTRKVSKSELAQSAGDRLSNQRSSKVPLHSELPWLSNEQADHAAGADQAQQLNIKAAQKSISGI
jgi:hypothetical protein